MLAGVPPEDIVSLGAYVASQHNGRAFEPYKTAVESGTLEISASDKVPESLQFTIPPAFLPTDPADRFAPYGQEVIPCWIAEDKRGARVEIHRPPMLVTGWTPKGTVKAAGLLTRLVENPAPAPSSPREGARLEDEAYRLTGGAIPVKADGSNPRVSPLISWGLDRLKNLTDLCDSYQVKAVVKADGVLHLVPASSRHGDPVATYTAYSHVLEMSGGEERNRYNRFHVWSRGEKDETIFANAEITTGALAVSKYGARTLVKELESGKSYTQCVEAAQQLMQTEMQKLNIYQVEIVTDPRLEIGDVIRVDAEGKTLIGEVLKLSIPFKSGETMRADIKEIVF